MPDDQILIVDDTPVSLKLTKILIAREGYRVLTATTAEEALDLIHRHLPALVLTDVMLPEIDGLELTRRIKQDERTRGIRVIALSACDQAEDERRALAAGCEAYLRKPVDTATLGAWIRTFLRGATPPATSSPNKGVDALRDSTLAPLRRQFLEEGLAVVKEWEKNLDGLLDLNEVASCAHQWVGAAGMLGLAEISRLSREVEHLVRARPIEMGELRDAMEQLVRAFEDSEK